MNRSISKSFSKAISETVTKSILETPSNSISYEAYLEIPEPARNVIYLAACAVNGQIPDRERVLDMDLPSVHAAASRHLLGAAVSIALQSAGFRDESSQEAIGSAIRKTTFFDQAWSEISDRLEKAGIWYMPLKGAVLKDYYPRYGMREFADHDILFDADRAEDVRIIMEDLGYTTEYFATSNHDVYHKAPVLNFEMHRSLFGSSHEEKIYNYFKDIENRLITEIGGTYRRSFTSEDFYIYMIAHEYKHYSNSGTGLRSLLDTYVYLTGQELDKDYISTEIQKLGIADFEEQNRSLAIHLFAGQALTDEGLEMLDYIIHSGTYGTTAHRVQNTMKRNNWGRFRYALERFRVPVSPRNPKFARFAGAYPFFYKHKVLLPALPFYRLIRSIKTGRLQAEVRALCKR